MKMACKPYSGDNLYMGRYNSKFLSIKLSVVIVTCKFSLLRSQEGDQAILLITEHIVKSE
jgi:hypothetical protein